MITQSARVGPKGVRYRVWAPKHNSAHAVIVDQKEWPIRAVQLNRDEHGVFEGTDRWGKPGDLYKFKFEAGSLLPDPATHFQPLGVHGPSEVIDHKTFAWPKERFHRPELSDLVIYECHVGTFTKDGTYEAAVEKLEHLKDLGVTALQLMPLGDFAGERNWGYDGVCPYAPARCYGRPDDLKRLVAAAHAAGLAVILDVVYNHLGPDGNYLEQFSNDYFSTKEGNIWGKTINFDGQNSKFVREHFIANVIHWMEHYHIDGFRLDATHAILDESKPHVLSEIAGAVKERGGFTIAEDERNWAGLITPPDKGVGIDAAWADDFHHVVKVALTGERFAHFRSYKGTPDELVDTVKHGWLFRGQVYPQWNRERGTECVDRAVEQFIYCISNHDQVGNRPLGERLNHIISPEAYAAASALLCLLPYTPMLFMGQEWAASTPFCFFTDHAGELGKNVSKGRLNEFKHYGADFGEDVVNRMPDPQEESTFLNSKLNWEDLDEEPHERALEVYRAFLEYRARSLPPLTRARGNWTVELLEGEVFALRYNTTRGEILVLSDLRGSHSVPVKGNLQKVLSSLDEFEGGAEINNGVIQFGKPETLVLEARQ